VHSFHPPPSNRAGSHSKSIRNRSGRPVLGNHRRGPVAAGNNTAPWWTQISEIVPETTVELAEPLPAEIQVYTVFGGGIAPTSHGAAATLIQFLTSPAAASVLKVDGMEPL
jgi:molybdate transport system substrate-binding protein